MCGRFAQGVDLTDLPQQLGHVGDPTNQANTSENGSGATGATNDIRVDVGDHQWHLDTTAASKWHPSFNIAPTNSALILYADPNHKQSKDHYKIEMSSFGLVPFYLTPPADQSPEEQRKSFRKQQSRTFNCRSDTLTSKHSRVWNSAKNHHRCVIPAQGYFEWTTIKEEKVPHFVHYSHAPFIFLVGLYAHNAHFGDDMPQSTFTICTGPATSDDDNDISWLHRRKPILVEPGSEAWYKWLDPEVALADIEELVLNTKSNPAYKDIEIYRVGSAVGNTRSEGAKLIKPMEQGSISDFFTPKPEPEIGEQVKAEKGSGDANDAKYSSEKSRIKTEDKSDGDAADKTKVKRESADTKSSVKKEDNDDTSAQQQSSTSTPSRKRKQPSFDIANMVTTSPRQPRSPRQSSRRTRQKRQ
ncbi:hypothetical protein DIURU_004480 [Diutina rugosa]|uniref:DUF159-domain-containing protein n=1 Tax=Diutina rugosa TaxID=5481 RepID=A0A642UJP4_DIURU|nr:uncharacterized protein DIURU_004480 [Diutina rugosa]KAA8899099.1 hypothetical protein DIURU_004480 [Diutina rugosa]